MKRNLVVASLLIAIVGTVPDLNAAGVGKAVARTATRRLLGKSAGRAVAGRATARVAAKTRMPVAQVMKLDRLRDGQAPIRMLTKPRSVFRYTSNEQAQLYRQRGVPSGAHFTVNAGPGRPLSAAHAKERYGLPRAPTARVEAVLPRGTTVKSGKVVGGQPGYGELKTYRQPLSPSVVKSVRPVQK